MKNNWIFTAIVSGIIGGFLTLILTGFWELALISAILITIIILLNNPKRRYMKAFWIVLSVFVSLNKLFFDVSGELFGIDFKFKSNTVGTSISIGLLVLALSCLLLDYLQRNEKLKGTIFEININKIKNVSGSNITIHQNTNKKNDDV